MTRRDALRLLGAGAAGATFGGLGLMTGCSDDPAAIPATPSAPTPPPAVAADSVAAFDPEIPYWLQGGFAPVTVESTVTDLRVTGALPPSLSGLYVRNGSNPQSGSSPHWFVGDGMLHGVRLSGGEARWYRNRYVRTNPFLNGLELSEVGLPGGAANQSNVALVRHAGRTLTLGEIGFPYRIATGDLDTLGVHDFDGRLTTAMTAHPKVDPITGQMHLFGYGFTDPLLTYHVVDSDGQLIASQEIPIPAATMVHDFAITERDVVIWLGPVMFAAGGPFPDFPYRWDPATGPTRVGVMPLGGPASRMRWVDIDPCFVFHGAGAHRDGDEVVARIQRLDSAFGPDGDLPPSFLTEWRIDTSGADLRLRERQLSDVSMDLPTIDLRRVGRESRHGWFTTVAHDGPWGFEFAGVLHRDHATGRERRWEPGPLERPGEALFVPEGSGEGEGWLLTYVYDRTTDTSALAVLDATDVAAGPVARVELPVRVPYGFHGLWVADEPG